MAKLMTSTFTSQISKVWHVSSYLFYDISFLKSNVFVSTKKISVSFK